MEEFDNGIPSKGITAPYISNIYIGLNRKENLEATQYHSIAKSMTATAQIFIR